jgi:CheY-like chemotaxis protein
MDPQSSGSRLQRRILIVEDHEDTRDLLVEHLRDSGYEVATADNGNDAIAAALSTRPDAIVLDLAMPVLDGVDALAVLRSYPATMTTPVVVYTANIAMLKRRAVSYDVLIEKPARPEDVERAVASLLEERFPDGETA